MSNFRNRAKETYAKGVEERKNWEPPATVQRVYNWWADRSDNAPEKENFCHFWRVIAIWAPLMLLKRTAVRIMPTHYWAVLGIALVVAFITWLGFQFPSFGEFMLFIVALTGSILAVMLALFGIGEWYKRLSPRGQNRAMATLFWSLCALVTGIVAWIVVALFVAYGLTVLWVFLAGVAIMAVAVGAVAALVTYIQGRRAMRTHYKTAVTTAKEDEYNLPKSKVKEKSGPNIFSRFFSGLADFLIFAFQVVRVNKWKICPTVEIKHD